MIWRIIHNLPLSQNTQLNVWLINFYVQLIFEIDYSFPVINILTLR